MDVSARVARLREAMVACGCRLENPLRLCWWCWGRYEAIAEMTTNTPAAGEGGE